MKGLSITGLILGIVAAAAGVAAIVLSALLFWGKAFPLSRETFPTNFTVSRKNVRRILAAAKQAFSLKWEGDSCIIDS